MLSFDKRVRFEAGCTAFLLSQNACTPCHALPILATGSSFPANSSAQVHQSTLARSSTDSWQPGRTRSKCEALSHRTIMLLKHLVCKPSTQPCRQALAQALAVPAPGTARACKVAQSRGGTHLHTRQTTRLAAAATAWAKQGRRGLLPRRPYLPLGRAAAAAAAAWDRKGQRGLLRKRGLATYVAHTSAAAAAAETLAVPALRNACCM